MPSHKRKRFNDRRSCPDRDETGPLGYPPVDYKHYLACPFSKHDPDRYLTVANACTERWGFKDIGKLNEHIQRVHSLQLGCIACKARFNQAKRGPSKSKKDSVEQIKRAHECNPREFTAADPQWMTQAQEIRYACWKKQGTPHEGREKSWRRIYESLFGTAENDLPNPYYDYMVPQHIMSTSPPNDSCERTHHFDEEIPSQVPHVTSNENGENISHVQKHEDRLKLDRITIEHEMGRGNHEFNWSVNTGIDSAYGSGNTQEPQNTEAECSPDIPLPHGESYMYRPFPEDTMTSLSFVTGGNPDEAERNYYERYLNI